MIAASPAPVVVAAATASVTAALLSLIGFRLVPSRLAPRRSWLRIPLSLSLGTTIIGVTVWTVGHLWSTSAAFIAAGLVAVWSLSGLRSWATNAWHWALHLGRLLRAAPLWTAANAVVLLVLLGPQLLLPVLSSDGLCYHLALPKLYLLHHQVFFYPWNIVAAMPQSAEMTYMLMMPLGGGEAAKWLHAIMLLSSMTTLMLFVHTSRHTRRAAVAAPLLLAVSPVVLAASGAAFVDLFVLMHIAVACVLIRFRAHSLLVGIALAGALTTKWTAAPAVIALGLCAVILGKVQREHTPLITRIALIAAPIVLAIFPLAVRNIMWTGDPFFPTGTGLLHASIPGVADDRFNYVTQVHRDLPGPLGLPWGRAVGRVQDDEIVGWHHLIGLLLAPLLLRDRRLWPGAAMVAVYLLLGVHYHPSARLSMPLLLGLAAFEGRLVVRLGRWAYPAAFIAIMPALLTAGSVQLHFGRPLDYLSGKIARNELQEAIVPAAHAAFKVNRQPESGVVLALDFPAPYLFDRPWIAEGIVNDSPLEVWLDEEPSTEHLVKRFEENEIAFLIATPGFGGGTPYCPIPPGATIADKKALLGLRRHLRLIESRNNVDLFRFELVGAARSR